MKRISYIVLAGLEAAVITLLLTALCSCGSTRKVSINRLSQVSNELEIMQHKVDSLSAQLNLQVEKLNNQDSSVHTYQTVLRYSQPDTLGKQYVIEEIHTESQADNHFRESTKMVAEVSATKVSEKNDSLINQIEVVASENIQEQKVPMASKRKGWLYALGFTALTIGWVIRQCKKKFN